MSSYKLLYKIFSILIVIYFGFVAVLFVSSSDKDYDTSVSALGDTISLDKIQPQSNLEPVLPNSYNSLSSKSVEQKIKLPILMYHHVATVDKLPKTDKVGIGLRVSPAIFEKQLQALQSKKYTTVNSFQIQDYLDGKLALPENPILLTFDDGFKDNYDNAFPLLRKYNMTGDFAIITSVLGSGEYMNWDNLKEMKNARMGIASHTHSHCTSALKNGKKGYQESPVEESQKPCSKFATQEKLTTGQLKYEFGESKKQLETNLGIRVSHLIYPFGFYNQQAKDIAKSLGYSFATTVEPQGDNYTDFAANPYNLERKRVPGQQTGELSGFFAN
jgi:peptidoglycan/xylan/chitin deacetylase (PgdA/CDA1 family)